MIRRAPTAAAVAALAIIAQCCLSVVSAEGELQQFLLLLANQTTTKADNSTYLLGEKSPTVSGPFEAVSYKGLAAPRLRKEALNGLDVLEFGLFDGEKTPAALHLLPHISFSLQMLAASSINMYAVVSGAGPIQKGPNTTEFVPMLWDFGARPHGGFGLGYAEGYYYAYLGYHCAPPEYEDKLVMVSEKCKDCTPDGVVSWRATLTKPGEKNGTVEVWVNHTKVASMYLPLTTAVHMTNCLRVPDGGFTRNDWGGPLMLGVNARSDKPDASDKYHRFFTGSIAELEIDTGTMGDEFHRTKVEELMNKYFPQLPPPPSPSPPPPLAPPITATSSSPGGLFASAWTVVVAVAFIMLTMN